MQDASVGSVKAKKQNLRLNSTGKVQPGLALPAKPGQAMPSHISETLSTLPLPTVRKQNASVGSVKAKKQNLQLSSTGKVRPQLALPTRSGRVIAPSVSEAPSTLPLPAVQYRQHTIIRLIAICIAPVAVCINFTNYGPLIPLLQKELHVDSGQIGLFSTLLFLGIALTNIPGGILADRFGSRTTMLGSLILVSVGSLLLPFFPNFAGMAICRAMIGLGAGAALVAGSHATAELGKYEALGQGLNGGVAQLGAGLGLFATPQLLGLFGWRGALFASGLLGVVALFIWLLVPAQTSSHIAEAHQKANPALGIRTPAIWKLGLANMGTFGLSNAITAWLAVYFTSRYGLSLTLAAAFSSLGLFAGIIFRPLGGILLTRTRQPILLIRLGTIMVFLGLGVLALPIRSLPLAFIGLLLFALGATLPYASIFSTAAAIGRLSPIGAGVAQGLIAVLASPVAIAGPPIIGLLFEQTRDFTAPFGIITLSFSVIAVVASCLLKKIPGRASIAI
jgi:nitrate/nitrite transporter NarK